MAVESDLLPESLLDFEEEVATECSFETEGLSSGVECTQCSDEEELCMLSSLEETIKTSCEKDHKKPNTKSSNLLLEKIEEYEKDLVGKTDTDFFKSIEQGLNKDGLCDNFLNLANENMTANSCDNRSFSSGVDCSVPKDLSLLSSAKETMTTFPNNLSNQERATKSSCNTSHEKTAEEARKDLVSKISTTTSNSGVEVSEPLKSYPKKIMAMHSDLLLTEYLLNFDEENSSVDSCEINSSGKESDEDLWLPSSTIENGESCHEKAPKKATVKNSVDKRKPEQTAEKREKDRLRAARNRKRRNDKIKSTEEELHKLKEINKTLNDKNIELGDKVSSLEEQIQYLKNVIENGSPLSAILGAVIKHSGLSFSNSSLKVNFQKRKRANSDENEPQRKKSNGGMCLHLTPGRMSLEFCQECDENAADE